MSRIVGGGGGGLTEDEVTTLIGRGEANGTAALDGSKNLLVPWNTILMRSSTSVGNILLRSKYEPALELKRSAVNTYTANIYNNNVATKLLDALDRNGATNTAVAAIYNPCKTLYNEHRPVCTKEYHLVGKYLDGADNPDVWFPIKGAGVGAEVTYSNRVLTLKSGTGATSASRCVIDQTKFPITSNFLEVTCQISGAIHGEGGEKRTAIGFMSAFSAYNGSSFVGFSMNTNGAWIVATGGQAYLLASCPLGRQLQNGDVITIRLDRQEGSSDIDIARFYVNGQKQWENATIPDVDLYAGVGVFSSSLTDVSRSLSIKYFGVRYVP